MRLMSRRVRTVLDQVVLGLAPVAPQTSAVPAHRVAAASRAHARGLELALGLTFALAEAHESLGHVLHAHAGKEGRRVLALAFTLALDDAADAPRRLVVVVPAPSGLGVFVGPEERGRLLGLGQPLDVAHVEVTLAE